MVVGVSDRFWPDLVVVPMISVQITSTVYTIIGTW